MSMPISMLEGLLHNKPAAIDESYIIQIDNEFVTVGELIDFWKEKHIGENIEREEKAEIQEQSAKTRAKAASKKKPRVGRTTEADI